MCGGGTPKMPAAPQPAPEMQDASVVTARDNERRRRRAASSDTILTSAQGVTGQAQTQAKTLLGQ